MQNWNFIPDHPVTLTLAADARLGPTDYINDQIWSFKLGKSEPLAISLETTFGLRARSCRLFPRFTYKDETISDPSDFSHPIIIHQFYPNYLEISFSLFSFVNVKYECWVPNSHAITGKVKFSNTSHSDIAIQMDWVELLLPSEDGSRMAVNQVALTTILSGKTANLSPVLLVTGGAQAGNSPYPTLSLPISIPKRSEKEAQWVHVALADMESSYTEAKSITKKNWSAEIACITRANQGALEIHTGNKDWDTTFLLSQNYAYQLFLNPILEGQNPSFVNLRNTDQGFSMLGDGSDYNHLWNGQSPLDTLYLLNFLLPGYPDYLKNLLDNYLATQAPSGEIDWKPGIGGQRGHLLAAPVLSYCALRLYECTKNLDYLKEIYQKLVSFFFSWFSIAHDRDNDQYPEWDLPIQTGYEAHALISSGYPLTAGVDISIIESPDLLSYLYKECVSLLAILKLIGNDDEVAEKIDVIRQKLINHLDQTWSDFDACYHYRDRESHKSPRGEKLGDRRGDGTIEIQKDFPDPIRPIIIIETTAETTQPCQVFIYGSGASNSHRIEAITANRFHWNNRQGYAVSDHNYLSIERIEINGIRHQDEVHLETIDLLHNNLSLMLPLWAEIPSTERAKILINLTLMNKKKYLGPYGLRSYPLSMMSRNKFDEDRGTNWPHLSLILEGLVQYDERKKAAEIFQRTMKPVIQSIHEDLTLQQSYDTETGVRQGAQNSISSLVPLGLFLKILGINILDSKRIEISGHNPFPWPVTIKYQGLIIVKHEKKSFIVFPNGQNISINNDHFQSISLES